MAVQAAASGAPLPAQNADRDQQKRAGDQNSMIRPVRIASRADSAIRTAQMPSAGGMGGSLPVRMASANPSSTWRKVLTPKTSRFSGVLSEPLSVTILRCPRPVLRSPSCTR